MNTKSTILFLGLLMFMNLSSIAQQALLTQNIRGQVVDKESQTTIVQLFFKQEKVFIKKTWLLKSEEIT